jgi:diguanylate cyclase (GGDEF)-like protein/PAS domain S-box-containing protein
MRLRPPASLGSAARRPWLAIALVPVIAIIAVFGVRMFLERADAAQREQILYGQVQAEVNYLSSLEWQAIAKGGVTPDLQAEVDRVAATVDARLRELRAIGPSRADATPGAVARYDEALDQEFSLLRSGDLAAARELDESEVDPAFEDLHTVLADEVARHRTQARVARNSANLGALLIMVAAAAAFGLLLWRFQRTRQRASVARVREATLRASEARFESMFENSSDLMLVVDPDMTVRYQSASVERILGYCRDELAGRKLTELAHDDDVAALGGHFGGSLETVPAFELRLRHRGGTWVHVELLGREFDDSGEPALVLNGRDVSQRLELERELRHRASHDSLTGLSNRALFRERLLHALDESKRTGTDVAVLFLDVDDFKLVNDSLGHQAGDDLLRAVAQRMKDAVAVGDTIARFGGDEFAVLLTDVDSPKRVEAAAAAVLESIQEPVMLGDKPFDVGASIGIAFARAGETDPEVLLRNADAAMYAAKDGGKGRFELFRSEMHSAAVARLELTRELQRALEGQELELHYQPIVEIETGAITGLEALLRWNHPTRGTLAPGHFLSLAESTGLIVPIGSWVLEEACRQTREWQLAYPGDRDLSIAVNVSTRQLAEPDFVARVARVLDQTGLAPRDLVLEITETTLLSDADGTGARIAELKALGVLLAVDDFGTGYSALSYLQRFDVDILKIDKSFVDGLGHGSGSSLVRGIAGLAASLELEVVAEGIEEQDQVAELVAMSSRLGQGYYFARPVPALEAERLVSRGSTSPASTSPRPGDAAAV